MVPETSPIQSQNCYQCCGMFFHYLLSIKTLSIVSDHIHWGTYSLKWNKGGAESELESQLFIIQEALISLHSSLNHALCNKVLSSFREKNGLVKRDSSDTKPSAAGAVPVQPWLSLSLLKLLSWLSSAIMANKNCALEKDTVMQISWSKVMYTVETLKKTYIGLHQAIFV